MKGGFYYFRKEKEKKQFQFKENKNIYLNNKILSDELKYVLDRKQYQINLGNSLEQPSLLLKPQFIRETTTEIKKGKEGESFNEQENIEYSENIERRDSDKDEIKLDYKYDNKIKIHNFINVPLIIIENLIPDENGEIILQNLDLNEYSFMHISSRTKLFSPYVIPSFLKIIFNKSLYFMIKILYLILVISFIRCLSFLFKGYNFLNSQ